MSRDDGGCHQDSCRTVALRPKKVGMEDHGSPYLNLFGPRATVDHSYHQERWDVVESLMTVSCFRQVLCRDNCGCSQLNWKCLKTFAQLEDGKKLFCLCEMSADKEIDHLVSSLGLTPHPEGGYFSEQYRTDRQVTFIQPNRFDGPRDGGSCIYYLLKSGKYVSFHLPLFDEIFLWHAGGPAKIYTIDTEGNLTQSILGNTLQNGNYHYQVTVRHDTWYAVEPLQETQYVLFGAVVIPGWTLQDWTQGKRADMLEKFPQHKDLIERLCKE